MNNNNEMQGFSGLSQLTSDILKTPEDASNSAFPGTNLSSNSLPKVFDSIELSRWPTLPLPWSSSNPGQTWVWEDYYVTFQKNPIMNIDFAMESQGENSRFKGLYIYHYSAFVFYRYDRNPHGPSLLPILVVSLEQRNLLKAAEIGVEDIVINEKDMCVNKQDNDFNLLGPLVWGVFFGEKRFNLGKYEGDISESLVRAQLFKIVANLLGLPGGPKLIGTLQQAHGHPETGLPEVNGLPKKATENKVVRYGCLVFISLAAVIGVVCYIGLIISVNSKFSTEKPTRQTNSSVYTPQHSHSASVASPDSGTSSIPNRAGYNPASPGDGYPVVSREEQARRKQPPLPSPQPSKRTVSFEEAFGIQEPQRQMFRGYPVITEEEEKAYYQQMTLEVQHLLSELGYEPGPVDGIYGRKTAEAIKSFQKDKGLTQDGVINQQLIDTLKMGGKLYASAATPNTNQPANLQTTSHSEETTKPWERYSNVAQTKVQPLPQSGHVQVFTKKECVAPLEIKTYTGNHYLVKLVDKVSGRDVLTVFVREGSTESIEVPLGTYEVRYAAGETWYGYDQLFGPSTVCNKADETFKFDVVGDYISGFTITLYRVADGNLSTSPMALSDF